MGDEGCGVFVGWDDLHLAYYKWKVEYWTILEGYHM